MAHWPSIAAKIKSGLCKLHTQVTHYTIDGTHIPHEEFCDGTRALLIGTNCGGTIYVELEASGSVRIAVLDRDVENSVTVFRGQLADLYNIRDLIQARAMQILTE